MINPRHALLDYLTCMAAVCCGSRCLKRQVMKGSIMYEFIATKVDVKHATCTK